MFADAPRPAAFDGSPSDDVDPAEALRQLAREVGRALLRYEHQTQRAVDREDLARRLHVSPASLYAYLKGTTLPNSEVFDSLLQMLGVTGPEAGRLSTLRDGIEVARRIQRGRKADRSRRGTTRRPRSPSRCRDSCRRRGHTSSAAPKSSNDSTACRRWRTTARGPSWRL